MSDEHDEAQAAEDGMDGPGAPTPLSALEVDIVRSSIPNGAKLCGCRVLLVLPSVTFSL
jgi:hypothetical protein